MGKLFIKLNRQPSISKEKTLDNTMKLLSEGYLYIPSRIQKYQSDLFQTRLIGKKVVCMSGEKAAQLFYDQNLFTRKGAVPKRIQETLFGKKAIQTLDGSAHMDRKLMFLNMMDEAAILNITRLTLKQWKINSKHFEKQNTIQLFDESARLFFQVACKWAGVPISKSESISRSRDMSAMIDAFGAIGPRHMKGRIARNRSEAWILRMIRQVREGKMIAPVDSALSMIAWHKDLDGELLEPEIAAVELINILRPITAIATYVTFGALAMHTYPEYKKKLKRGNDQYLTMFAQEVRRFYPFGPFLGAKVRSDFVWQNHQFQKDDLVFLDIYGTNHDARIWESPNVFNPQHFAERQDNPFSFIPQGGGDYKNGTRCPGEMITLELLKVSLQFLASQLEYEVPLQNLNYSYRRIPTIPKSRFIMANVRR